MTTSSREKLDHALPTPGDRPGSSVVIYDGHCKFCTASVRRLARWDRKGILSFVSLHDSYVAENYPDLTHDQLMKELYLIDSTGKRYAGAFAFRWLALRLPYLWPIVPLIYLPFSMPLWSFGYRTIAKLRYRFGKVSDDCDNGSCKIHFH